ncbi:MAG TPA: ribosome biogenesis GTPase Der [Tepidisphaeraceae bacterium]|nr:ribosome biogenesis GTPase Der [Tepidisphaeraceae bacterium]
MKMPVVAIVGRPNVGKSSLLNALAGKRISIVQDMPGVTRDRVAHALRVAAGPPSRPDWRFVELVDTGGYGFDDPDLSEQIRKQIELAIARADLVLFVVDCQTGLSSGDQTIAGMLRKIGVKVVLLANKADSPNADVALGEFARLGFGTPIGVSAMQSRNLDDIFAAIRKTIDLKSAPKNVAEPEMLLAIVGKRNAGKSTFVNAVAELYGQEADRVIVSEVPGTTRDSVDVRFEKDGKILTVIDTAGVRKKRQMVTHDIEYYSFHRAERSIRRADVVIMLMDGTEAISDPDKKLSQYVAEQFKPVLLVINKWDLAMGYAREQMLTVEGNKVVSNEELMKKFEEYVRHELRHLSYAPIAFITARESKNVQVVLDLAQHLRNQASARLTTGQLNRAIKQILQERTPSSPTGRRPKILYATQVEVNPPTIVLFVNNPNFLNEAYRRFVVNRLRELLPYAEVPIKLVVRGRGEHQQRTSGLNIKSAPSVRKRARSSNKRVI